MSGFTLSSNTYFYKACPRSPGGETQGVSSHPRGEPGPWVTQASLCLDSPENGEVLAFEPGILF